MKLSARPLHSLFLSLLLSCVALIPAAHAVEIVNNRDYITLSSPQPTDAGKRVEVTEFFYYTCPFCNGLDPDLSAWVKSQGDKIVFKRVAVDIHESAPLQRLYYALEAMGVVETYHAKIFKAIHVNREPVKTDADVLKLVTKLGVDARKFSDVAGSFAIQTKLKRSEQLAVAYKIQGVPTIAVDGRYLTSPSHVHNAHPEFNMPQLNAGLMPVLDALVAKAQQEKPKK